MLKLIALSASLVLLAACQKDYNSEICDELSMMSFKGYPNQSREFKDNCKTIKVTYTKENCQNALAALMVGTTIPEIKKQFGEKSPSCFTKSDLEKFSR